MVKDGQMCLASTFHGLVEPRLRVANSPTQTISIHAADL